MKITLSHSLLCFTGAVIIGTSLWLGKRIFFDDPYDNIELMNDLLSHYSNSPRTIDTTDLLWAIELRNNWEKIKQEFENYEIENIVPLLEDVNYNNSLTVDKGRWRSLILRTFCIDTKATKYFPETMKLINNSDSSMTLAMFSLLEPGTKLPRHNGMYKGVLRYHLGLSCPSSDSGECYLEVFESAEETEGLKLKWENGKDFIFDDVYLHRAVNKTTENRIILLLDVRKEFDYFILNIINRLFLLYLCYQKENTETTNLVNLWVK